MKRVQVYILHGLTFLVAIYISLMMRAYENRLGMDLTLNFDDEISDPVIHSLKFPDLFLHNYTLEKICQHTHWRTGVYLNCTNIYPLAGKPNGTANPQGIANTYNVIMICLRWAIDAGVGFVLPRIAVRSQKDIRLFDDWRDYEFLFDEAHLRKSLFEECPQLRVIDNQEIRNIRTIQTKREYHAPYSYGLYNERVDKILQQAQILEPTDENPVVLWENEQLFLWHFCNDSQRISNSLQSKVIPSQKLRFIQSSLKNLLPTAYVGLHTRLESDMILGSYEQQIKYFLKHYGELYGNATLPAIYISIGDRTIEDRFRKEMNNLNLTVISKWTLASRNITLEQELASLGFDQLALVDWEILVKAPHFFGCGSSSFSFSISKQRGSGNISECACHLYGEVYGAFYCSIQ